MSSCYYYLVIDVIIYHKITSNNTYYYCVTMVSDSGNFSKYTKQMKGENLSFFKSFLLTFWKALTDELFHSKPLPSYIRVKMPKI